MAQGGLVVMAGMVAPSHNPKRQGRASGQGLGINALASCGCREWSGRGLWLVALASLVHIIINLYNTRLAKTR